MLRAKTYDVLVVGLETGRCDGRDHRGRAGLRTLVVEEATDVNPLPRAGALRSVQERMALHHAVGS